MISCKKNKSKKIQRVLKLITKKILFVIPVCYCFYCISITTGAYAETLTAGSCSLADVSSAISNASPGDTVLVPAGTCTWSTTLTLTKRISLIGGNGGTTQINSSDSFSGAIAIEPATDINDTPVRVSGFTFDGQGSNNGIRIGKFDHTFGNPIPSNVRVDHCKFNNCKYPINNASTVYGVVDNCQFGSSSRAGGTTYNIWGEANWYGETSGVDKCYNTAPQMYWEPGTNQSVYFEDNIFYVANDGRVVAHNLGSRGVYRYNKIIYLGSCPGVFELHGHQDRSPATFGVEIYGNRIEVAGGEIYKSRGGSSMVFYNDMIGGTPSHYAYAGTMVTCPTTAPEKQMIHDTYLWNNRRDHTGAVASLTVENPLATACGGYTNRPTAGRDIFNESETTPGITCGSLANRPSSCSIGQGYWATDQSCSDLTGMVGNNPTTPISGTFYKCTATNTWTEFYTPLEYPHPIRRPNPPVGVKIQ
jgi:hypothetical protein